MNSSAPRLSMPMPETEADGVAMDLIFIEGLRAETVIGIHDNELHVPQPLVIDVHAGVTQVRACDTDSIADTIDYSEVRARLLRLLAEHRIKLLEALAEHIADILIHEFGASWVRVKVIKPKKFDDVQAVGVQIERRRRSQDRHGQRSQRAAAVLHLIGSGMVPTQG